MSKKINVVISTRPEETSQTINFIQGNGDKGAPTRIKAVKGARYELQDVANKNMGPEGIRSKRVNKIRCHLFTQVEKYV
jgi:hypothetical protein